MQLILDAVHAATSRVFADNQSTFIAAALFAPAALAFYWSVLRPTPTPFWGEDLDRLGVKSHVKYPGTAIVCGAR